jgi:hypothetical protein
VLKKYEEREGNEVENLKEKEDRGKRVVNISIRN